MLKDIKFVLHLLERESPAKIAKLVRKGYTLDSYWDNGSERQYYGVLVGISYSAEDMADIIHAHYESTGSFKNIKKHFLSQLAKAGRADTINLLLDTYLDKPNAEEILCLGDKGIGDIAPSLIGKGEFETLDRLLPYVPSLSSKHDPEYPIITAIKTKELDNVIATIERGASFDVPDILETVVRASSVDVAAYVFDALDPQPEVISRLISDFDADQNPDMVKFLRGQFGDENWRLHDGDKNIVTCYKEDEVLKYGTLEIFNFAAGDGERLTIMRNLDTKQEMLSRQDFNQISDRVVLKRAAEKLIELGGELPTRTAHFIDDGSKSSIRLVRKVQKP